MVRRLKTPPTPVKWQDWASLEYVVFILDAEARKMEMAGEHITASPESHFLFGEDPLELARVLRTLAVALRYILNNRENWE